MSTIDCEDGMETVIKNPGKILAWLLVGACSAFNIMLLLSAFEVASLSGTAQGDLWLLLALRLKTVGLPIVMVSIVIVAATFLVRERDNGWVGVLRFNSGAGVVAVINSLIPLGIFYWLLSLWR